MEQVVGSPELSDLPRRVGNYLVQGPHVQVAVGSLVRRQLAERPDLREWWDLMTDEQSQVHMADRRLLGHQGDAVRYFHAWRIAELRRRLGAGLATSAFLDVGDTDGLMLKHLGQPGLGFNLSPDAIEMIRSNGIEAQLGDAHGLPFEDGRFDVVLCFETLEHVESPAQLLDELARVCKPDGRVFISIPWVPRTFVHPRVVSQPRGAAHIFEFCRKDFGALVTHTPLEIADDAVCHVLGPPSTPREHAVTALARCSHIVGGIFHSFQFFELRHQSG